MARNKAPKKISWIIPFNTAILCGVLCVWAARTHDTVWASIMGLLAAVNVFFVWRWVEMNSARR
jgi:hypothetical protein